MGVSKAIIQRPIELSSGSSSFLLQESFTVLRRSRRRFCHLNRRWASCQDPNPNPNPQKGESKIESESITVAPLILALESIR